MAVIGLRRSCASPATTRRRSTLEVRPARAGALSAVATAAGPGEPEAPVSGGIPVRGAVRGADGVPVPRAAVTLISLGGRQLGRSVAQADGAYAVDAPGAGSYVLIAAADGFQPQASTIVVNGEPVAYDILLSGTSGLNGVVRAAGQDPRGGRGREIRPAGPDGPGHRQLR